MKSRKEKQKNAQHPVGVKPMTYGWESRFDRCASTAAQLFQGWCSTNGIPLIIPKTFLVEVQEESSPVPEEKQPLPEVKEPAVSSWCSKVKSA